MSIQTASARTVTHGSFTIERAFRSGPAKVFDAFADPAKKRRWFAEGPGFHLDSFVMDFRVGGEEKSRFRFVADKPIEEGTPCSNDTVYMDIVPGRRIVISYSMSLGGAPFSVSLATMEFLPQGTGTLLVFTEQAAFFEGSDGIVMREQGTRELLGQLAAELGE
ncbi:MAG TPA: SRPBCC family protein [Hyphomonas sp.]|nr:SRPBCC family protein [Hyphomonas sp.]HRX75090.1 SRPBCC family protein [Hyphomonas sp.]